MTSLCIAFIRFYQRVISPFLLPSCRFKPTCSHYALDAYHQFGFIRGTALTVWRLLRCQPFCDGGEDPLPDQFWGRHAPH